MPAGLRLAKMSGLTICLQRESPKALPVRWRGFFVHARRVPMPTSKAIGQTFRKSTAFFADSPQIPGIQYQFWLVGQFVIWQRQSESLVSSPRRLPLNLSRQTRQLDLILAHQGNDVHLSAFAVVARRSFTVGFRFHIGPGLRQETLRIPPVCSPFHLPAEAIQRYHRPLPIS